MAAGNLGAFDDPRRATATFVAYSESCPRARYHRPTHSHSLRLAFIKPRRLVTSSLLHLGHLHPSRCQISNIVDAATRLTNTTHCTHPEPWYAIKRQPERATWSKRSHIAILGLRIGTEHATSSSSSPEARVCRAAPQQHDNTSPSVQRFTTRTPNPRCQQPNAPLQLVVYHLLHRHHWISAVWPVYSQ
jgi:hypothetical protein